MLQVLFFAGKTPDAVNIWIGDGRAVTSSETDVIASLCFAFFGALRITVLSHLLHLCIFVFVFSQNCFEQNYYQSFFPHPHRRDITAIVTYLLVHHLSVHDFFSNILGFEQ